MFKKINLVLFILLSISVYAHDTIYIWKNISGMSNEGSCIYRFVPEEDKKNGAAVIICPGGSYHHLGLGHEGFETAEWFRKRGVEAFVLKYRVAMNGYQHPAMLQDIQRALQIIRENCREWGLEPDKVGAVGFSAGGHLVTMATFTDENTLKNLNIKTDVSLVPDFTVPVYPVVSMGTELGHRWSTISLLGRNPDKSTAEKYSMEKQVKTTYIPFFVLAAKDDPTVDYRNSVALDQALTEKNVPHLFVLMENGGHGFGMDLGWDKELENWLETIHILK